MTERTTGHFRNLSLASLGAVLEYFDFIVYVYVAAAIGKAFFPLQSSTRINAVQTFGIYAIGYLVRPLAGVLIAHFSDRIGRKKLFLFTVMLMSVPTFMMGLLRLTRRLGGSPPRDCLFCACYRVARLAASYPVQPCS